MENKPKTHPKDRDNKNPNLLQTHENEKGEQITTPIFVRAVLGEPL